MEENSHDNVVSLSKKTAANRRNAQLSTGPRTEEGKSRSRFNAVKHGVLASAVLITEGEGREDAARFQELLGELTRDSAPIGKLEEMQVEKIAVCWWEAGAGITMRGWTDPSSICKEIERRPRPNNKPRRSRNYGSSQAAFGC